MNKKVKRLNKLIDNLEKNLHNVEPVIIIVTARTYIENLLNVFLDYFKEEPSLLTLSKKIDYLYDKDLFDEKIYTDLNFVRYRGNSASHCLDGRKSEAEVVLEICKDMKQVYENKKSIFERNKLELEENKVYKGLVTFYRKKHFGFLKEEKSGKKVYFNFEKQNLSEIKKGKRVEFLLKYSCGDTPYEAVNMSIIDQTSKIGLVS